MKDSDIVKIEKLQKISTWAIWSFVVIGISSMGIAILGSFLVGIIAGIVGNKEWIRIVFAVSAFVGAISSFSYGLSVFMYIWITVIKVKTKSLALRLGISAFIGYGFAFLVAIVLGCGVIWWGMKVLINSDVVGY